MIGEEEILNFLSSGFLHQRLCNRLSSTQRGPIGALCEPDSFAGRILWKFALCRPQKFHSHAAFTEALNLFELAEIHNVHIPLDIQEALATALRALRLQNSLYPDLPLENSTNEAIAFDQIQREYLGIYVNIAEVIYKSVLKFLLAIRFSVDGVQKNLSSKTRDLHDQAKRYLSTSLSSCYSPIVRNSVSHGSVKLVSQFDVEYKDDNATPVRMSLRECPTLVDDLLDVCNGVYAAALLSVHRHPARLPALQRWFSEEALLCFGSNEMFTLDRIREDDLGSAGAQMVVFGEHTIWDKYAFIESALRAIVLCKHFGAGQERFFLSVSRGVPSSFFVASKDEIPSISPKPDLGLLASRILRQCLVWNEHVSVVEWLASRFYGRHVVNWLREHGQGLGAEDSFDVREIRNNSAGRQSRFDAAVVVKPKSGDLDADGFPKLEFLWSIFGGVFFRWIIRGGNQRNPGSNYLRYFRSGLIHVYYEDARLRRLRNSGLGRNLLFRLELPLGTPLCRVALGGRANLFRQTGPFLVSVNPNAVAFLHSLA